MNLYSNLRKPRLFIYWTNVLIMFLVYRMDFPSFMVLFLPLLEKGKRIDL